MSAYSGRQGKGAARRLREKKRTDAEAPQRSHSPRAPPRIPQARRFRWPARPTRRPHQVTPYMSERPTIHHRDRALNEQQGAYMSTVETPETIARGEYIAGLRVLADALEANPSVMLPYHGRVGSFSWVTSHEEDPKGQTAAIVRAIGGKWDKGPNGEGSNIMLFSARVHGLSLDIITDREAVCRRVVTGTREVTKTVPAPGAPTVEITETIEDVEWICEPLLAEVTA